jgi:multiple sugar transport system substrate-binding protein
MPPRSTPRLRGVTALFLTSILAAGSLAACSNDDDAGDSSTLTFLSSFTTGNATGDQFNKLRQKFTEQTGIKTEVQEANTNDMEGAHEAAKLAGKERDIVILNLTPSTTDWLPQGQVVDVKKYMNDWGITDKLEPAAIEYWTQGDKVAGFPFSAFNWPIWYNMDLLKKAGVTEVPKTVDELIASAAKLRAAGVPPMIIGGAEWPVQNFVTWMAQQYVKPADAQKLFEKGGYCANADAVKGLDVLGQLRDAGVFVDNVQGFTADQMTTEYFQGRAAMMPSGSWSYSNASPEIANATTLAGFPVASGGVYSKPTAYQGFNTGFFVSPNGAKKLDAVEKFIKFMYEPANLQSWVSDADQILAVKGDLVGAAQSQKPLVTKGNKVTKETVDFMLLPDSYIPSGVDYQPAGTEFIGKKGMKGSEFCKTLDKLYTK